MLYPKQQLNFKGDIFSSVNNALHPSPPVPLFIFPDELANGFYSPLNFFTPGLSETYPKTIFKSSLR